MSQRLAFEQLTIERAPGIPRGEAFTLASLSPSVTLIHGPNGAGKTTTARLIHALLWPGQTELTRAAGRAVLHLNENRWEVELEGERAAWWCAGQASDPPEVGPAEARRAYSLALDQLIQVNDADFAKRVADATLGGYDITAAAEALGYQARPSSPRKARQQLETKQNELREAQRRQQAVAQEAAQLASLREKKAAAEEAGQTVQRLQTAREYVRHEQHRAEVQAQLDNLPTGLDQLIGDELERAQSLRQQRDQINHNIREQQAAREDARRRRDATQLPTGGLDPTRLTTLRGHVRTLQQQATELDRFEREHAEAAAKQQTARQRLGDSITDAQLQAVQVIECPDLTQLAREAEQVRAARRVLHERRQRLVEDDPTTHGRAQSENNDKSANQSNASANDMGASRDTPSNADVSEGSGKARDYPPAGDLTTDDPVTAQQGMTLLSQWLRCAPTEQAPQLRTETRRLWLIRVAAGLIVALVLALAVLDHWAWSLILIVTPIFVWLERDTTATADDSAQRQAHYRRDYEALALPQPEHWSIDRVVATLDTLHDTLGQLKTRASIRERLKALEADEQALAEREEKVERQRREVEQKLGLSPDISDEWLASMVEAINQYHAAHDQDKALTDQKQTAQRQFNDTLEAINEALKQFDQSTASTAAEAAAQVEHLAERQAAHKDAAGKIEQIDRLIENSLVPQLEDIEDRYARCFTPVGLQVGDEAGLNEKINQLENYHALTDQARQARALRDRAGEAIGYDEQLLSLSDAQLEAKLEEQQALAQEHESVINQIRDIENHIQQKKQGHEVSDALAALRQSRDELLDKQEADFRAVTGHVLADHVRETIADRARPAVFKKSNELLTGITRGRYQLQMQEGESPVFVAWDTELERVKTLDELSLGERVQVLLAVRLGFVEHEERAARLPVLMDETLGNADEARASAIIDAIIEIAKTGRQVFYFSAQHDEVAKWQQRLDRAGVDYAVKDLAAARRIAAATTTPRPTVTLEPTEVPAPNGQSHETFGQTLQVPGLDPMRQATGQVHLWHIIGDPETLHSLLEKNITTVGQLRQLLDQGGRSLLPGDRDWARQAEARIKALDAAFEIYRIGRGQPIDAEVLAASGAVTDTFMDEVSALAADLDGDPDALLEALANKQVPRWQQNKTDQLRDYLESAGYLDPRPPATAQEIHTQVLARLSDELAQGLLDQRWLEHMLAQLTHGSQDVKEDTDADGQ